MKITDKIYKIIAFLVIAGIAIPFVTALGATIEPEVIPTQNIDSEPSTLPDVVVTKTSAPQLVNVVDTAFSECSLQVELSEQPSVQGQKGINLYQPADCYQITVASAPRHSSISLATLKTYATLSVEAKASQNITTSHVAAGHNPYFHTMYVPGNNLSLEYRENKNPVDYKQAQIGKQNFANISQHYTHIELQIFLC